MFKTTKSPWMVANSKNYHTIPRNLLPKFSHHTDNNQWLEETYQYFHCFDKNAKKDIHRSEEDLQKWKNCAVSLINNLKETGFAYATNEIVRCARVRFDLKTKKGFPIGKWTDVVALFQDHEWYYSNVEKHRSILYFFQYGIFRNGHNNWLIEASYKWMDQYEVMYNDENIKQRNTKTKKGFVQEILHAKASNTIQDRFLRITRKNLGEHILCRNKKETDTDSTSLHITEMTVMNYNAYLVEDKLHPCKIFNNDPTSKIEKSINDAINSGMSKLDIMQYISNYLAGHGEFTMQLNSNI